MNVVKRSLKGPGFFEQDENEDFNLQLNQTRVRHNENEWSLAIYDWMMLLCVRNAFLLLWEFFFSKRSLVDIISLLSTEFIFHLEMVNMISIFSSNSFDPFFDASKRAQLKPFKIKVNLRYWKKLWRIYKQQIENMV